MILSYKLNFILKPVLLNSKTLLSLILYFLFSSISAQRIISDSLSMMGICDENGFCIPGIDDMRRPKGFSFNYTSVLDYKITSQFKDSTQKDIEEINQNESVEIKLKFPLKLSGNTRIIMGIAYKVEEYRFEKPNELTNSFHQQLEDKPLRSLGTTFYVDKRFKGKHYIYSRVGLFLNGDFEEGKMMDYFRSSVTAVYGTKVNKWKTWGVGLSYSYRFGDLSIYPIIHYNKQITERFGFEMALPVKTEFRYRINPKNYLFFLNRLSGDNYILNFDELENQGLFLGKSNFVSMLTLEKEIYDFVWVSFSAGLRVNIDFDLSEETRLLSNRDPLLTNKLAMAPIFNIGIFIVPPRKWLSKLDK